MKRLICLLLVMLAAVAAVFSQDTIIVPPAADPTWQVSDFVNLYSALEGAIIVILGYLHNWIPGLNLIKSKWLRIILIGAVTAVIFVALGWNTGLGTAFVFFQTVGLYEIIFKKVQPSPPVNPPKTGK